MEKENVTSLEKEAFRRHLSTLSTQETVEDAAFADAVYTAISQFRVDATQFRDMFGLSKDAVERWTTLKNLPQPMIRPRILEWIIQQL